MTHIVESVGKWGVVTTPLRERMHQPRPGDPVDITARTEYPFKGRTRATISSIQDGRVSLCIGGCSKHLYRDGSVSISGGPFTGVDMSEIQWSCGTEYVTFWNWGSNLPGADQGVYYKLPRPLWKLLPEPEPEPQGVDES